MMDITAERKTKLQAIVDEWNRCRVSGEQEYTEELAAATLLSIKIDEEYEKIISRKGSAS